MSKISIILATARPNFPMPYHPDWHVFGPVCETLAKQTFKNFELVISDVAYDLRPDYFKEHLQPFPVKHIKFENGWTIRGLIAIAGTFNHGIVHADPMAELYIFMGDCQTFSMNSALEIYWDYYCMGLFATAFLDNVHGDKIMEDDRKERCKKQYGGVARGRAGWGVMSASAKDTIEHLNGFEEMFDGSKCQEDCNLSDRLTRIGKLQVMDLRLYAHCEYHAGYAMNSWGLPACTRCNNSLGPILEARYKKYGGFKANVAPLTNDEYDLIKRCWARKGDLCYTREPARCSCLGNPSAGIFGHMEHPDAILLKYLYPPKSIADSRKEIWK